MCDQDDEIFNPLIFFNTRHKIYQEIYQSSKKKLVIDEPWNKGLFCTSQHTFQ